MTVASVPMTVALLALLTAGLIGLTGLAGPAFGLPAPASATSATSALSRTTAVADDDAFYIPPNPLPAGRPGDIIRSRPAKAGPPSAQELADAWQVMYLSTDALGKPDAVTGTILVPKGIDASKAPVVGFAPGTQGAAFRCAPSKMLNEGAFYEQPAVNDMLRAGYAVAVTDYEGYHPDPRTTYVVGRSMGPALIDSVRAAQRLPEARLSPDSQVAFRGYSQGGGAAMWAGQTQPTYAPELKLVGVVGGGVPSDLTQVALSLDGKKGFGLLAYSLIGLDHAYPELKLAGYLNDAGRTAFAAMEKDACTMQLILDYQGKKIEDYMVKSPVLDPPWLARVAENKLGADPVKVRVLQYHATQDELVAYPQAKALRDTYCSKGVALTWKTFDTGHITPVFRGNADASAFLADPFAAKPATSNC